MFKYIKSDLPSSIVVYFVALSLILGIAIAIGVPLFSGLISGLIAGFIGGSLSGTTFGVSDSAADKPITQVVGCSSTNVQSETKSKLSTTFHGFLIIISVILFPKLLNMIALSVLVVVLLLVGYKFANPSIFNRMFTFEWKQYIPIVREPDNLEPDSCLELDISIHYLDNDIVEILQDFYEKARNKNINITIISGQSNVHNPQDYNEFFKLDIKRISA